MCTPLVLHLLPQDFAAPPDAADAGDDGPEGGGEAVAWLREFLETHAGEESADLHDVDLQADTDASLMRYA